MQITAERIEGVEVITVGYASLDAETATAFRSEVDATLSPGARVVFDLAEVAFVDSAGLGAILSCLKRVAEAGGSVGLCRLRGPVRALCEMVRLHRVMEIRESRDDAVHAMRG